MLSLPLQLILWIMLLHLEPSLKFLSTPQSRPSMEFHLEKSARVSITKAVVPDALLPIPVKDELVRVRDALGGTFIAWPRNLISSAVSKKEILKPHVVKKKKQFHFSEDHVDDLNTLPTKLPSSLKVLCQWVNTELKNGVSINTTFDEEIFGIPTKVDIYRRDIHAITNSAEISNQVIVFYMSFLHEVLKKSKMTDMIAFVDPAYTGALGCGNSGKRAFGLAKRYEQGKPGQIFLVSYNSGDHWTLTVVNPTEERVHFMDSLRGPSGEEWVNIVNSSIGIYNRDKPKKGKKKVQRTPCLGVSEQVGKMTCGLWIMRYMKDIVGDKNQLWYAKWEKTQNNFYTQKDIDEVRMEWAKHVFKFAQA